jgi:hypothetical protein
MDCCSSGIGYTIYSILAANNCKVYLGVRPEQKSRLQLRKGQNRRMDKVATYPLLFNIVANIMGTAPAAGSASALFDTTSEEVSRDR